MKKIYWCFALLFLLVGCGNNNKESILNKFSNKINNDKSYLINGTLEIYRNEDLYTYDVESAYLKEDKYRVSLTNKTNNHEQVILKNNDGVYVVTPSLNKSFKFQSEWPYNNSQIYLLQPIVADLKNDKNLNYKKKNNTHILTARANYINDKTLVKQKVYLDKNFMLKKVEVLNKENEIVMCLKVNEIKRNINFDNDYFNLKLDNDLSSDKKENLKENANEKNNDTPNVDSSKKDDSNDTSEETKDEINKNTTTTSKATDVLYPMYVPVNTYLNTQDVLSSGLGDRTILTFTGNSPFTFVQSSIDSKNINYIEGDPTLVADGVGAVSDHTVSWISNDKEYYLTSDTVSSRELLLIADSLSVTEVGK